MEKEIGVLKAGHSAYHHGVLFSIASEQDSPRVRGSAARGSHDYGSYHVSHHPQAAALMEQCDDLLKTEL